VWQKLFGDEWHALVVLQKLIGWEMLAIAIPPQLSFDLDVSFIHSPRVVRLLQVRANPLGISRNTS